MKLSVQDRLVLLNCLPTEGDFTMLRIVRELRESLSFSEADHTEFELKVDDGHVGWNPQKAVDKEVEIGGKGTAIIVKALGQLDTEKKLTENHLSVYEKFMGE
ncbi:hypothetical protein LCGC14_0913680 [marine sediment metagenome]|uniref:Uncharacterized protein n=1 Tax=marine sediment metagenome TaxID=412755 RepID=A0A0F9NSR2_9ZZZZ